MKQYWARHQGKSRWGVRTTLETSDALCKSESRRFFVREDRVDPGDDSLVS